MSVIGTPETRRSAIREHLRGVLADSGVKTEWLHPFDAGVTDAVFASMKENLRDWKNGREEEWKKLTAEGKEAIGEGLEELYDMFDIFL